MPISTIRSLMLFRLQTNTVRSGLIFSHPSTWIFNGLFHLAGFRETMSGCCGTGLVEASFLCNLHSLVCPNASQYVFWDSIHPTEKAYKIIFNSLRPSINRACK